MFGPHCLSVAVVGWGFKDKDYVLFTSSGFVNSPWRPKTCLFAEKLMRWLKKTYNFAYNHIFSAWSKIARPQWVLYLSPS